MVITEEIFELRLAKRIGSTPLLAAFQSLLNVGQLELRLVFVQDGLVYHLAAEQGVGQRLIMLLKLRDRRPRLHQSKMLQAFFEQLSIEDVVHLRTHSTLLGFGF